MKNSYLLLAGLFAVAGSVTVHADVLTPEQALMRVTSSDAPSRVRSMSGTSAPELVFTQSAAGQPAVYVFNSAAKTGFMIVSADDAAPALLGYSDTASKDSNALNPTLQWWLQEYARQIEWLRTNGNSGSVATSRAAQTDYAPIEPMTTTRWNQDAPFNNDCPEIGGTRCVTGCVATALAQIMKYHNWPAKGTGSNSYTPESVGSTVSVNFGNTTYDWDNMLNVYDGTATAEQKDAVATLMLSAGVSVNMDYTTSESSATSFAAAQAMVTYFNYDKGIVFYSRDYYTIDDWNDLVYNQLKTYGPVQYSGQSNEGGHSFVCDGYSSDGYFHINWGWGGMSDGYFLLTALNPTSQGIGGSTSGFNFDQDIIGNVRPANGTSAIVPNFVAQSFVAASSEASLGSEVGFTGPFYSYSLDEVSGALGVKAVGSNGQVTYIQGSSFNNLAPEYGSQTYYASLPENLAEDTYTISPAVMDSNGNWYDIPVMVGAENSNSMTVEDGMAVFSTTSASNVTLSDITENSDFYIGSKFELSATVTNTGSQEYLGGIRLMLINSDNEAIAEGDEFPLDLSAGESDDITYLSGWTAASGTTLSAGTYSVCFVDANGNQLSDLETITLNAESTPTLKLTGFTIKGGTAKVSKEEIEFTGTIEVSSGYFGNTLNLVIFPDTGGTVSSVASYSTDAMFISEGESKDFTLTVNFNNAVEGETYFAMLYNGNSPAADNQLVFTIDGTNAVEDIEGAATVAESQYYTLSGVPVSGKGSLAPGLYIVLNVMTDGTTTVSKTIVK